MIILRAGEMRHRMDGRGLADGLAGDRQNQDLPDYGIFRILRALTLISLGGNFRLWGKAKVGRSGILKIPPILKILIPTNARNRCPRRLGRVDIARAAVTTGENLTQRRKGAEAQRNSWE